MAMEPSVLNLGSAAHNRGFVYEEDRIVGITVPCAGTASPYALSAHRLEEIALIANFSTLDANTW